MNDADKKAFEEHYKDTEGCSPKFRIAFKLGWQAALEWRDSQVGEVFGYFKCNPDCWVDCAKTDEGAIALYEAPPPAQINHQLVDALQFIIDCQESTNGSDYESGSALREAAQIARAALAATQMRGDA